MNKHILSAITCAALIFTAGVSQPAQALGGEKKADIREAIDFDPHALHGADADALFWVNQPNGAKGVKKAIIPFFQIQFVLDAAASATGAGGAHTKTAVHLQGPTAAQMQAITDEIYASFASDLQAAGLEVVTPEQAQTFSAYNEIMAASKPSGEIVKGMNQVSSAFFAPTGMKYYFLPTMLSDLAGGGSMTAMGNTQIIRREADLMGQADAAVVGFRAVVDFASLSASNRRGLRALARNAKTKAEFGLVIKPVATQVFLVTPNARAR